MRASLSRSPSLDETSIEQMKECQDTVDKKLVTGQEPSGIIETRQNEEQLLNSQVRLFTTIDGRCHNLQIGIAKIVEKDERAEPEEAESSRCRFHCVWLVDK
jgi:hypothetical protein